MTLPESIGSQANGIWRVDGENDVTGARIRYEPLNKMDAMQFASWLMEFNTRCFGGIGNLFDLHGQLNASRCSPFSGPRRLPLQGI
jgi:hypothetical protein